MSTAVGTRHRRASTIRFCSLATANFILSFISVFWYLLVVIMRCGANFLIFFLPMTTLYYVLYFRKITSARARLYRVRTILSVWNARRGIYATDEGIGSSLQMSTEVGTRHRRAPTIHFCSLAIANFILRFISVFWYLLVVIMWCGANFLIWFSEWRCLVKYREKKGAPTPC